MPQPTLAAFNFTKKVKVGDQAGEIEVKLPTTVSELSVKQFVVLSVINVSLTIKAWVFI